MRQAGKVLSRAGTFSFTYSFTIGIENFASSRRLLEDVDAHIDFSRAASIPPSLRLELRDNGHLHTEFHLVYWSNAIMRNISFS